MLNYSIQAVAVAVSVLAIKSRRGRVDSYALLAVVLWTIAVIAIFYRYGQEQVLFYSNDQLWHQQLISVYLKSGIHLNIPEIINNRYIVTVPALIASKFGFDPMLAIKVIQLVMLLSTYEEAKKFVQNHKRNFHTWHMYLIVGPTSLFISALALRDLVIVYVTMIFFLRSKIRQKLLALFFIFLLRPHLAVAVCVGSITTQLIGLRRKNAQLPFLLSGSFFLYIFGTFSYYVGANIQTGMRLRLPESVLSQEKFVRLFLNFVGLQFLALGPSIVNLRIDQLLLSRLVFFESLLVPILFVATFFRFYETLGNLKNSLFFSFIFLYGLTSQTDWNSSRQNLPFLAVMATLAVVSFNQQTEIIPISDKKVFGVVKDD